MTSKNTKTYLNYIQLVGNLVDQQSEIKVDAVEMEILNMVFLSSFEVQSIVASDIYAMRKIASSSTIRDRTTSLVKKNLLKLVPGQDARRKYLSLAPESAAYFESFGNCLVSATIN